MNSRGYVPPVELLRALGWLTEPPQPPHRALAAALDLPIADDWPAVQADYTECFVLQCYPYASVYLGSEGLLGGDARDRIGGFWRALGLTPPREPDHLAALLSFYASLAEHADTDRRVARARRAFLWEHLLSWLPVYLNKVEASASRMYRAWAERLLDVLAAEAADVGAVGELPLHLRAALPLPEPDTADLDATLSAWLAPVRTGLVLTRADLAQAGRELNLGVRQGDRRFVLRHLLAQDAPGALVWLRDAATRAAKAHRRHAPVTGVIAASWVRRAQQTAERLETFARQAAPFAKFSGQAG